MFSPAEFQSVIRRIISKIISPREIVEELTVYGDKSPQKQLYTIGFRNLNTVT